MAVYTEVSIDEARPLMQALELGELQALHGCKGGIENTNYFASTGRGEYVLTLFERLDFTQLPYYLHLMKHLAQRGIPVPDPAADARGEILHRLKDKPCAVVNRLRGQSQLQPGKAHCSAVGATLAAMHLAGADYVREQPHLRGLAWWNETVPSILPFLQQAQSGLLLSELAYQNHVAALSAFAALPRGPVHADLFRDNVMFEGEVLTGFSDFYFAGTDTFLFDLAVCLNDWCVDLPTGVLDEARAESLVSAYQTVRPLQMAERRLMPAMQRAAALRFWISRLWDFHLPREASVLTAHDPGHFERVLRQRSSNFWTPA